MSLTSQVEKWVDEVAALTGPGKIAWADGSKAEYDRLVDDMLRDGTLLPLNSRTYPNCYLHRSNPSDVARTEQLTFICTPTRGRPGPPTTGWRRRRARRSSGPSSAAACRAARCG